MTKKILVFGGAGFLGKYLVEHCLKNECKVVVADIAEPKGDCKYDFIKTDITDFESVMNAVDEPYDAIFNFAGFAHLERASSDPLNAIRLNVLGNTNCLEACRLSGTGQFIYASSSYALCAQGSFYGISKHSSEKIVEEYGRQYGMKYTIVRYGSVYSERESDNNYLYSLIKKAIQTKTIVHVGDGGEQREYIHADDCARLSYSLIGNPEYIGKHVMLTGNEKMTKGELFKVISEMLDNSIAIHYDTRSITNFHYKYTPYSFRPEMSVKLMANPHIDIGQGILKCIEEVYKAQQNDDDSL